jgi:hypothetical protein
VVAVYTCNGGALPVLVDTSGKVATVQSLDTCPLRPFNEGLVIGEEDMPKKMHSSGCFSLGTAEGLSGQHINGCYGLELHHKTGLLDLTFHAPPLHDNMSSGLFELNGPGSPQWPSLGLYRVLGTLLEETLFWKDRWIQGQSVADIAPRLLQVVPKRRINTRTVQEALIGRAWMSDIRGALSVGAIVDYLHLWNLLLTAELGQNVEDKHIFRLAANGKYSAKFAYEGFFIGSVPFEPYERIWKTWAPPKCPFFLWLVAHKRCWTADRLAKRGLDHPDSCPLCETRK